MRILLIASDASLLMRLSEYLESKGNECETFTSPVSAVFAFAFGQRPFDVVVAEASMPCMSGAELLSVFKHLAPEAPVVLAGAAGEITAGNGAFACIDSQVEQAKFPEVYAVLQRAAGNSFAAA